MPRPTPFHERTAPLCESWRWKHWGGYLAPCVYGESPEREYNAIRQGAALLDVTPLYKYELRGPDAGALLDYVLARAVSKLKPGRMAYVCWTDDEGKLLDDGTCARLAPEHFLLTSGAPAYGWLVRHAPGFDVAIEEITDRKAALALQGPTSRDLLRAFVTPDPGDLGFFGIREVRFGEVPGWLSRTGYTGDLGYELWVDPGDALALWDTLARHGADHGLAPVGLDALDISRIEAGFVLRGVDYTGAQDALIPSQKSTPYEMGLGWTVKLDRPPFVGQAALRREAERGSAWAFVGLVIDWPALERLCDSYGLPPQLPGAAWRTAVPLFRDGRQIGRATSGTWSPILKKNLALATVEAAFAAPGSVVDIETTVEWARHLLPATVAPTPFFDPPRKRS
ncbi:MAG: aminomethyl transferase family protein [Deltaproteobacteria bacterium]|nr:aminomethyl transferase family protein [Deltaproteobacteria bacterium]